MENSGGGVTFTAKDVTLAKRILMMLNSAEFKLDGKQIVMATEAMMWFDKTLIKHMDENILELIGQHKNPNAEIE